MADFAVAVVDAVPGVDGFTDIVAGPGVVAPGFAGDPCAAVPSVAVPGFAGDPGVAVPGAFTTTAVSHIKCEGDGEARDAVGCDGPGVPSTAGSAGDVIAGDSGDPGVALADVDDLDKGKEGVDADVDAECNDTGGAGTGEQIDVTAFVQGDEGAADVELGNVAADVVESLGTLPIRLVAAGTGD